jgi:hypothetical protein
VLDELFACFTPEDVAVLAELTGRWIDHLQRLQETS